MNTIQKTILAIACMALIASCSYQGVVNNPEILAQVEQVSALSIMDMEGNVPLKRENLDSLNQALSADHLAAHYMKSLYWFVDHNETEHLGHTLGFLKTYLVTGKEAHCTPHELWHAALYAKHGENGNIPNALAEAKESYPFWIAESELKRQKFPQFYLRLDEQVAETGELIAILEKKNYSNETMQRIKKLGETAIC